MTSSASMTAEQFAERQHELEDGGRWLELIAGRVVVLQPPDEAHGNVVRNLSKALAESLRQSGEGYACFELGLLVTRGPDTVRRPPICCYVSGEMFAESDKAVTEARPELVIEIASTSDRRKEMEERVREYLDWGVRMVWVIDPIGRRVHTFQPKHATKLQGEAESLIGYPVLSGFRIRIGDLFADPEWWRMKKKSGDGKRETE